MRATLLLTMALAVVAAASARLGEAAQRGSGSTDRHAQLRRDVEAMTARLRGPTPSRAQVIADAGRLTTGYRSLMPYARSVRPPDYAVNLALARLSLGWLARASALFGADPSAAQAFLGSYDAIGGFYGDGRFYRPGAFVAYAGAARLAGSLALAGYDVNRFEGDMNRFALAYGTLAATAGMFQTPWTAPADLPEHDAPQPPPPAALKPVPLPEVDVARLSAEEQAAWSETRDRFRNVAAHVHEARVLLDDLAHRLQQQHVEVHPVDAANALKMQGYLEDAAELIRARKFDVALEALQRAEYIRMKLKSVTGQ